MSGKDWRAFEKLAAQIYSELSPGADVTHNDRIHGIDSGLERQIDVSIRYQIAAHSLLAIVQVRKTARRATVNDVGEFAAVVADVRANKGILICRGGFTAGAETLARNRGIDICNIHDARTRDWSLEISLPILWIDLLPELQVQMQVKLQAGDSIPSDQTQWVISVDRGKTRVSLFSAFVCAWNERRLPLDIGKLHTFRDPRLMEPELQVLTIDEDIAWRPIRDLALLYTVSRRVWLGSFSPEECRGILDCSDGTFTPSYFPIGKIPAKRDESWLAVERPEELAVTLVGTLITSEGWQIDSRSIQLGDVQFRRLGDEG